MYQKLWTDLLAAAEAVMASLIALYLYIQVRKIFIRLDASGNLPIEKREIHFFAALFTLTMLFSAGKVSMGILWMHIGNLVILSFLAFTDFNTKLLDVPVLGYLFAQNIFFYITYCVISGTYKMADLGFLGGYIVTVIFCCVVKAFAIGDGCIYFAMIPVMLIMQEDGGHPVLFLFLMIPLILFLLVESGKAIMKKCWNILLEERKPFAPYLLAGYIISFLVYIKMCHFE